MWVYWSARGISMRPERLLRDIRRDQRGATAIEFAVVSGAFFMLMLGIIEYGLVMYSKVVIEATMQQSVRDVSIGKVVPGCSDRVCSIQKIVKDKTATLINPQSVRVTATVVTDAGTPSPSIPDVCLDDINNPYPASCIRWQENCCGSGYQPPAALSATSLGQAGDLVEVRVTYLWHVFFPIFQDKFGENGVLTITSSAVVKNEPF